MPINTSSFIKRPFQTRQMINLIKHVYARIINRFKKAFISAKRPSKQLKKQFRKVMSSLDLEARFTQIYQINYWNSNESISGHGSTLALTNNLRKELPMLFEQFKIRSVFDGPCGDFNWMKLVVNETDVDYTGADIVLPLIERNQSRYGSESVRFIKLDLTKDSLPTADLMICRDCLFHLSYDDCLLLLTNFTKSNFKYLLTTTYYNNNNFKNVNIITGHFRMIDLHAEPFYFPRETLYKIDDWIAPEKPRKMCLWTKQQVIIALEKSSGA